MMRVIHAFKNYTIFTLIFTFYFLMLRFIVNVMLPSDINNELEYWLDNSFEKENEEPYGNKDPDKDETEVISQNLNKHDEVHNTANLFREKMIFIEWLNSLGLQVYLRDFLKEDVISIEDVYFFDDSKAHFILGKHFAKWSTARQMLPSNKEALENFKSNLWNSIITTYKFKKVAEKIILHAIMSVLSLVLAVVTSMQLYIQNSGFRITDKTSLLSIFTGRYLDPHMCEVYFMWRDPYEVGSTVTFVVRFFQRNGLPYPICDNDQLYISIEVGCRSVTPVITLGGTESNDVNKAVINFTVRQAGSYSINVTIKDTHIRGSPFYKTFYAGNIDPNKTVFERRSAIEICCKNVPTCLMIDPRDSFNNSCLACTDKNKDYSEMLEHYNSVITQVENVLNDVCFQSFTLDKEASKICFDMIFAEEGCYFVEVFYDDILLQNGSFTCVVLNGNDKNAVAKYVNDRNISFEAKLIRIEGEPPFKPKKVTMFISTKLLTIQEHMLKFIPKRITTFRLCPSTKLRLLDETANGIPCFVIDDGRQPKVYLTSTIRNIIAATYTQFLLNNIGGSETFRCKQNFFNYAVRQFHLKHPHEVIKIVVNRNTLLKSSLKATKNFTVKEWCKNFEITFQDEEGIDWGGIRREWIQVVCNALFDPKSGMFKPFSDSPQALIHPCRRRSTHLKYYEFTGHIIGKCLYESALGPSYSQYIKAKFTRSFLAYIIGLRINYTYFKYDDPDLYTNKIMYILQNDVNDMDMYFVEEEYSDDGRLRKVIDLIPNGSKLKVTNKCKVQYMDSLAHYRLITKVKDELDCILMGITDIIPDNLLSIFDENELEMLLCGTDEYDVADFKAHHIEISMPGSSTEFSRILNWFWIAVSNFSKDEFSRLLQFITGSSQLPPGGFKDLNPQIQITAIPSYGSLPVAHTCFNELCLPNYESYEQLEKSLLLAINEGFEGFSLM